MWNVERLGIALLPLLGDDAEVISSGLREYQRTFEAELSARFAAKLGWSGLESDDDFALLQRGFDWLAAEETDMTLFFRGLSRVVTAREAPEALPAEVRDAFYGAGLRGARGRGRRVAAGVVAPHPRGGGAHPRSLARRMNAVNPKYVLRNWLAQEAIDAAHQGDDAKVHALLEVMRRPFDEQPGREHYAGKRPEWARSKPGCSALSCSS